VAQHPSEFRRAAVERIRTGESVLKLSQEIGVHHSLLYKWVHKADVAEHRSKSGSVDAYAALHDELRQAKELLADQALELDFFKGALQRIKARRQPSGKAGEKASTPKSGQ
jgi:transposase-like protein